MRRPPSHTLVYDGQCRVCQRGMTAIRSMDRAGAIEIVASQDPGVRARFSAIPAHAFDEAMHLIARDGTIWSGAAAIEEVLRVLPRTRWFAPLFSIPLARGIAARIYRWFARNRHKLGCGDHCKP